MSFSVKNDVDLTKLNTFRITAKAKEFADIETAEDLEKAADFLSQYPEKRFLILGGGSDILFSQDFDGIILRNHLYGVEAAGEDEEFYYVKAASGEDWHSFILRTLDAKKPGLENLTLIPGTVGGAPMQNIGAYGMEVAERIHCVEYFDLKTKERKVLSNEECDFGYRTSVFKKPEMKNAFITSVTFKLPKKWEPVISYKDLREHLQSNHAPELHPTDIYNSVIAIRKRKLPSPHKLGSAGSFFKNPVLSREEFHALQEKNPSVVAYPMAGGRYKVSAAWLIDNAGLKGLRMGDVGVYEKQPLIIVNYGSAFGEDVVGMAQDIRVRVKNCFNVKLEPEVVIV